MSLCVLEPFPVGDIRTTDAVYLRLIEKPIVDFLFVLIELFSLGQSINQSVNHFIVRRHDRTHTWTRKIQ